MPGILHAFAERQAEFVLAGSLVLALHGADIAPNDVDIVPRLTGDNLARIGAALSALWATPAHIAEWKYSLSRAECERWRPQPMSERNLDHLFVTRYGMLDIVPHLAGEYDDLLAHASQMNVHGYPIWVSSPFEVFRRIEAARRFKDVPRLAIYRSALALL